MACHNAAPVNDIHHLSHLGVLSNDIKAVDGPES